MDLVLRYLSIGDLSRATHMTVKTLRHYHHWLQGALGELYATLAARNVPAAGPAGGPVRDMGRVASLVVPSAELAIITHAGPPDDVDRAYGTLAAYVTDHALAVDGPMREYYLVGQRDTADAARWRTEIGWPVFRTRPS